MTHRSVMWNWHLSLFVIKLGAKHVADIHLLRTSSYASLILTDPILFRDASFRHRVWNWHPFAICDQVWYEACLLSKSWRGYKNCNGLESECYDLFWIP